MANLFYSYVELSVTEYLKIKSSLIHIELGCFHRQLYYMDYYVLAGRAKVISKAAEKQEKNNDDNNKHSTTMTTTTKPAKSHKNSSYQRN